MVMIAIGNTIAIARSSNGIGNDSVSVVFVVVVVVELVVVTTVPASSLS